MLKTLDLLTGLETLHSPPEELVGLDGETDVGVDLY